MKKRKVVYFHRRKDTNEIFYVGIGNNNRAYDKNQRSEFWKRVSNKVGYNVEIIHTDLTWDEACELETKYIKKFGRKDLGLGELVNMTDGGDGCENMVITDEHRKKTSNTIRLKMENGEWVPPMLGKKMPRHSVELRAKHLSETYHPSEEHKKILSEKLSGEGNGMFGKEPWNKDKKLSKEHIQKLIDNHKGMTGQKMSMESRAKQSESNKSRKLEVEDVIFIREHYKPYDPIYGGLALGEKYGVKPATIRRIVKRYTWKHLP